MHQGSVSRTGYATDVRGEVVGRATVILNVYDLHPMNEYGYAWGMGAFHSGVEIAGREYTFAGGGGIFDHAPRGAPNARFREAVKMGSYRGGTTELNRALDALREEFAPDRYNVLSRNCNSFSSALCEELLGRPAPGWVNRLAWMGSWFSCLVPPQLLGEAPVNNGQPGGGGYQMIAPPGRRIGGAGAGVGAGGRGKVEGGSAYSAFAGSGMSLGVRGGISSSQQACHGEGRGDMNAGGSGGGAREGGLSDRRDRVRAARLAALERANAMESSAS